MNTFIKKARTAISSPANARRSVFLSGAWFLAWGTSASANDVAATAQTGVPHTDAPASPGENVDYVVELFKSTHTMFTQLHFADHAALVLTIVTWLVGFHVIVMVVRVIAKVPRVIVDAAPVFVCFFPKVGRAIRYKLRMRRMEKTER